MKRIDRIDVHSHAFPLILLERLSSLYPDEVRMHRDPNGIALAIWNKAPLPEFDLDERLRAMDAECVEREVLSTPPIYGRFDEHTAELCRLANDLQREICARVPARFSAFVHLPYHDSEAGLRELERCCDDPAFVGVALASNMNGRYPGAELSWLWKALTETRLPAFIHPVAPCGVVSPFALPLVHFPTDTALCASQLILSGTLEKWPDVSFILPHYGGSLSVLASRLDMILHPHFPPHPGADLPAPPSSYVARFYVDTAQGFSRAAYRAALDVFGHERMLYGSDYFLLNTPWRRELNAFLDSTLRGKARRTVLRGNAERILRFGREMALEAAG